MVISDACEIQFWPVGEPSFNTEEEGYTDDYCFHQKFLCTGTRRFQGYDEDGVIRNYLLIGFDEDGELIYNEPYEYSQEYPGNGVDIFEDFPLSGWINEISGESWVLGAAPSIHIDFGTLPDSKHLATPVNVTAQTFQVTINVTVAGDPVDELHISFLKDGVTEVGTHTELNVLPGTADIIFNVNTSDVVDKAVIFVETSPDISYSMDLTINSISTVATEVDATPVIYSKSLVPSDESMCDKKVSFKVGSVPTFEADVFADFPIEDWVNVAGAGPDWTPGLTASVTLPSGAQTSDYIQTTADMFIPAGTFDISSTWTNNNANVVIDIDVLSEGVVVGSIVGLVLTFGFDEIELTESITVSQDADQVRIRVRKASGASTTVQLILINTDIDATDLDYEELYYSDAIDFVSIWANSPGSGRVDIQYRSIQNFADLIYDSESPYFQIQLEGRFRKEKKITAQKSLELTEMVLNTAASVKKQRKLTIDDVADYMHTKINLILAHAASGSVLVNGIEISVEEEYEEGERPETYPLTPAEIFLTIKDYYKHNVI